MNTVARPSRCSRLYQEFRRLEGQEKTIGLGGAIQVGCWLLFCVFLFALCFVSLGYVYALWGLWFMGYGFIAFCFFLYALWGMFMRYDFLDSGLGSMIQRFSPTVGRFEPK